MLSDELKAKIREEIGEEKDIFIYDKKTGDKENKPIISNDASHVPYHTYSEEREKAKALKQELEDLNSKVSNLDSISGENESLKTQLKEIKSSSDKFKEEFSKKEILMKKEFKLKENFLSKGVKPKFLKHAIGEIDLESVQMDNDNIIGGDDLFNKIKESYPEYLTIKEKNISGAPPKDGDPQIKIKPTEKDILEASRMNLDVGTYLELVNERKK